MEVIIVQVKFLPHASGITDKRQDLYVVFAVHESVRVVLVFWMRVRVSTELIPVTRCLRASQAGQAEERDGAHNEAGGSGA